MTETRAPSSRRGLRAVATLVLAAALTWAAPASAHTALLSSDPKSGSTVADLPTRLSLTFTEDISTPAYLVLTAPDGAQLPMGEVKISGPTVSGEVLGTGGEGTYTVAYRVVSVDGHPVTNRIAFYVGHPSEPVASAAEETDPAKATAAATATATERRGELLVLLGVLVVGGTSLMLTRRSRRSRRSRPAGPRPSEP